MKKVKFIASLAALLTSTLLFQSCILYYIISNIEADGIVEGNTDVNTWDYLKKNYNDTFTYVEKKVSSGYTDYIYNSKNLSRKITVRTRQSIDVEYSSNYVPLYFQEAETKYYSNLIKNDFSNFKVFMNSEKRFVDKGVCSEEKIANFSPEYTKNDDYFESELAEMYVVILPSDEESAAEGDLERRWKSFIYEISQRNADLNVKIIFVSKNKVEDLSSLTITDIQKQSFYDSAKSIVCVNTRTCRQLGSLTD